jgi:probable F420-dependent oxidoreductase
VANLGALGVWQATESLTAAAAGDFARQVEAWGYSALWIPETVGRDVTAHAAFLLGRTDRLTVASGIANIYLRTALAAACAQKTLLEQSGGRFVMGLGVSHAVMIETLLGEAYRPPVPTMRAYLEVMAKAPYIAVPPADGGPKLLGALGPKMMALAADLADGAHTYHATPEHTAEARAILGPGKLLCPEQPILLETDPARARGVARTAVAPYVGLPNYRNNWKRLGFADADFENGGSDRLMDAVVAWGDEAAIRARIQAHYDAGADHVCVQALRPDGAHGVSHETLAVFAPNGSN